MNSQQEKDTPVIITSSRLHIKPFQREDAAFILRLLNEDSFLRYIGDKNVRNLNDAKQYLINGPLKSYQNYGFGLCLVQLKGQNTAIGMCGLLQRPELKVPDLGYAFLPEFCRQGYALEAAQAVLSHEMNQYQLAQVQAVTMTDNTKSVRLLEKAGFQFKENISLYGSDNFLYEYNKP